MSRDITGLGGELSAAKEGSGTVTFGLTDLYVDVFGEGAKPDGDETEGNLPVRRIRRTGSGERREVWLVGWKAAANRTIFESAPDGCPKQYSAVRSVMTPDPIRGGSANPYGHADQGPINAFDLNGECTRGPGNGCSKHDKTGSIGESRHEERRRSRRKWPSLFDPSRGEAASG